MIRFSIVILSAMIFGNTALCDDSFVPRLSLPRDARWALVAVELKTGKELARAGNAPAEPLTPGSLVKLFTTGAVLDHLEGNGTLGLTTTILHDGEIGEGTLHGNLFIVGRGNALLSAADLKDAANKIAEQGIHKITGDIIADDTFFDSNGLERSRKGAGYAPVGALGLDLHTVAVTVTPNEPGKPPQVSVEPRNDAMRLAMEARTVAAASSGVKVNQLDDTDYKVSGNIAVNSGSQKWRFPLNDPALYAAGALKAELNQVGVKIAGNARKGKAAVDSKVLAMIAGPDIKELIREMNVNSLNVVADNLLLLLGAETYGAPGTREKGLRAVNKFLDSLDLPKGEAAIVDGSGLREENHVTARFMAGYLQAVSKKTWFESFRDCLPRAGMDGTLREIGYKDERFRVKSGRLENAFALAGYGVDGKGREIAFAYIVKMPGGAVIDLERSGAEVMRYLGTEVLQ